MYLVIVVLFFYWVTKYFMSTLRIPRVHDKHVLITGCDTGFGNLLAKRLDYLGFSVFAGCLTEAGREQLNKVTSHRVTIFLLDVTDDESVTNAYELVKSRLPYGRGLHGVVNNAGINESIGMLQTEWMTIGDYKKIMDVNLYGMVRVTTKFLPLVRAERGRIVNTSSIVGRLATGGAPYTCSKYAVEAYSDTIRSDCYRTGIKVSIIEPSGYRTKIINLEKMKEKLHEYFSRLDPDVTEYYGQDYPDKIIESFGQKDKQFFSGRLHEVVNAYQHALTSKYPQGRYIVGKDGKTIFRFLWNLPEWLLAYILSTMSWPLPKALRERQYRSQH